ncbi:MAG: HAD family phosphatase, partial [Firmicutes bacterium]|nr:HAD family phosphatase [Bacillota bacterium]
MIKGIIFDFDGTLFDSMSIWDTVGDDYLRSMGREPEEDLKEKLKPLSLLQVAEYLKGRYSIELSVREIMDGIDRMVEDFYFHVAAPREGIIPLLEELVRRNIRMCIATATDRYLVEGALKRFGMERFFSDIFTCTEVGKGKDSPEIFRIAMARLETDRETTAVFEDAYHAVHTAKGDGFKVVVIRDAHEIRQEEL